MMELLIPEEMSPISFRSSCFDSFFPAHTHVQEKRVSMVAPYTDFQKHVGKELGMGLLKGAYR